VTLAPSNQTAETTGVVITVCAECGQMRSVLFLNRDRWFCTKCRAEGAAPPNMYPIA
jgi:ribosomal protein L37AE/L43A